MSYLLFKQMLTLECKCALTNSLLLNTQIILTFFFLLQMREKNNWLKLIKTIEAKKI